ncbi:hypothetical protein BGW41_003866 [Actinomortierella wolfii]|nr:hypothetical protein BGW41_003866 [Actinomortierella wolfii]
MAAQPIVDNADAEEALLKLASKTVDDQLGRDLKYPELADLFTTECSSDYGSLGTRQHVLRSTRIIGLPDNLFEQYDLMQCRCFMGVFPEINRVWITIDHRLFLWNYSESEYESYEELDQVIINVALVKPKPGTQMFEEHKPGTQTNTFDDSINYILVIVTPIEVHLLGVSAGSGPKQLQLYITNMSVPTDNITMKSVVGTPEGRIFMNGSDGRLWEILYQAEEGWFSKKCSKKEVLGNQLSYFVPSFLLSRVDPIVKVTYDETRNIMYGLTEQSNIEVIRFGDLVSSKATLRGVDILKDAKRKSAHSRALDDSVFKIADIHPITTAESASVQLLVVTTSGCRLYFGKRMMLPYSYQQPTADGGSDLYLLHVRLPPMFENLTDGILGANGLYQVHQSLYNNGVFLAAHALSDAVDTIIASAPNSGSICKLTRAKAVGTSSASFKMTELASISKTEGKVWAMTELPGVDYAGKVEPAISRNELASQLSRSPRSFLVLTNSGINVLQKRRPIDLLQTLLPAGTGSKDLHTFFVEHGFVESCAMCIAILCSHPTLSATGTGSQFTTTETLANAARRTLLEWGGKPYANQTSTDSRMAAAGGYELGRPVNQMSLSRFTYRHTALGLYLARILRPIWKRKVTKLVNNVHGLVESEISDDVLTAVQKDLFDLRKCVHENIKMFTPAPVVPSNPPKESDQIDIENAAQETKSLKAILALLTQCIEGIAFVLFLIDSKMSDTVANIPTESQQALMNLTYETLLTTQRGHNICRELITAVINKQMGHHMSVDAVSDTLQRICGSFCNTNDVIFYKAMEHLRLAKTLLDPSDIEDHARESLRLFKQVPQLLVDQSNGTDKLQDVCKQFMTLKFYPGAVELALTCAEGVDPSNKAALYVKDGMATTDPRVEQYNKRYICYNNVVSVLQALQIDKGILSNFGRFTLETALQFDDNLFHTYLYDWLLAHGRADYLLEITSPYIEDYLKQCTMLDSTRDLLWRFYVKNDQFSLAARELGRIAESTRYKLNFVQRMEYLSLAVSNAKSCTTGMSEADGVDSGELLGELEDKLDVANIQLEVITALNSDHALQSNPRFSKKVIDDLLVVAESQLLDITNLYYKIVEPLHLYEIALVIFHASDLDDEYQVRAAWEGFIAQICTQARHAGRSPLTEIAIRVKDLGRRFYPSATVTPINTLVQILERTPYLKEMATGGASYASPGWAVDVLHEIGFPYEALFDSFHLLIETKKNEWTGARPSLVLIQDIEYLLSVWYEESTGKSMSAAFMNGGLDARPSPVLYANGARNEARGSLDRFKAHKVNRAIDQYLNILRSASWMPAQLPAVFDPELGGPQGQLQSKAAELIERLQVIQELLQSLH